MSTHGKLATVIPMPVPQPVEPGRLTRIARTRDLALDVDRMVMRRHILAALLRHSPDGIRGNCYCGLHPRRMWMHMGGAIAIEAHLPRDFVGTVMDLHRNAVGLTDVLCDCGETYSGRPLGREEHIAEAVAANIPDDLVRHALTAIREAGRNPRAGD